MSVKLSKAGKMPCKSWSLQAIETCPGSIDPATGGLVPACQGCYATQGNYRFANVKAPRIFNRADWQRPDWSADMIKALQNEPFFRWFDSGDCYALALAEKILQVMIATPNTQHWLPTRMWKFTKFRRVLDAMNTLPNVVVRYSNDGIHGETMAAQFQSTIVETDTGLEGTCGAYARDGKCGDCRMCWDRSINVIRYPQHGKAMARVNLRLKLVA